MNTGTDLHPVRGLVDHSGTIATGGTAQTVLTAKSRSYLLLQNLSTSDLWVDFGTVAVVGYPSIRLGQYDSLDLTNLTDQFVSVVGATTGQSFTAKEA